MSLTLLVAVRPLLDSELAACTFESCRTNTLKAHNMSQRNSSKHVLTDTDASYPGLYDKGRRSTTGHRVGSVLVRWGGGSSKGSHQRLASLV